MNSPENMQFWQIAQPLMGLTHSKGERGNNAESREKEKERIHMRHVDLESQKE